MKQESPLATIINGKAIAKDLESKIALSAEKLITENNITPCLGVIMVEGNPASEIYVRHKRKKAESLGIKSIIQLYPADVSLDVIQEKITSWNNDDSIHGILLQLPLPEKQDAYPLIQTISPSKDVDGLHSLNIGMLSWQKEPKLVACTPSGCLVLMESVIDDFTGLHAVIVGSSNLVGRPLAQLLLQKNCTISIAHSKTKDLGALTSQADILIVATGRAGLIKADMVKAGAVVIDVGINRLDDGRIVGDVCRDEVMNIAGAITPVPGGVGPMTIACLMRNTIYAACMQNDLLISSVIE